MKILNDFTIAIASPRKYRELLNNSMGRVALYTIIIILISGLSLIPSSKTLTKILGEYYHTNIPEFTFENQTLKSEDDFDLELAGTKFVIDTARQLTTDDFNDAYGGFLFDGDSMLIKNGVIVEDIKYSDITDGENITFTKESLYEYSHIAKGFIALTAVAVWLFSIPGFFVGALFIAAIAVLLMSFMPSLGMKLSFGKVYKLALYSRALPIILKVIFSVFTKSLPPFIGTMLSVLILAIGIKSTASSSEL